MSRWVGVLLLLAGTPYFAQSESRKAIGLTPWGDPDLSGIWDFATLTPLQRPPGVDVETFTEEQAAEFEREFEQQLNRRLTVHAPRLLDYGASVNEDRRTSLIVDPPDGQIPPLTQEAAAIVANPPDGPVTWRMARQDPTTDGPENRGLSARCLVGFNSGPPFLPGPYNNNAVILQTPNHVVVYQEMIHESRIIPLDGRPHLPGQITQWLGDSRGHWQGDTLVVESNNFTDKVTFNGAPPYFPGAGGRSFSLVERFTRSDTDTLTYEFTVSDPTWWTAPWPAAVPMTATAGPVYEYACHEGNRGLINVLLAGRAADRRAADRSRD